MGLQGPEENVENRVLHTQHGSPASARPYVSWELSHASLPSAMVSPAARRLLIALRCSHLHSKASPYTLEAKKESPDKASLTPWPPKTLNPHLFFFLLHSPSTWVMLVLPPEDGWFSFPSSQGLFLLIIFSPMHWQALCIQIKQSLNIS